jgi:hypothetical protein
MAADISSISYFLPIFSFLLIFVITYAVLKKSGVLGDNAGVSLFVSLILASFFIVNTKMVDFVQFSMTWFSVFLICAVFIFVFLGFMGKDSLKVVAENKGMAVAFFIILAIGFAVSAAWIFNWAIDWTRLKSWFNTDWFGFVLLVVIGGVVAWVLSKK